ncbi:hypothetical protein FRC03_010254 [Tulasnella sp. 419]|nr:hypothetical protein FRC03_010254 [Tulasnella sp. 419]
MPQASIDFTARGANSLLSNQLSLFTEEHSRLILHLTSAKMSAYYPSNRQRLRNVSQADSDAELSTSKGNNSRAIEETQRSPAAQESFLIFPEPLIDIQGAAYLAADSRSRKTSIATTSTAPPAYLPSPTGSSWSLQTSLLASVEANSPRSEVKDVIFPARPERSESRSRSRSILRDWEEVPSRRPLPRGRQGIPLSVDERGIIRRNRTLLEQRGNGWAWTLGDDDEQEGMLIAGGNIVAFHGSASSDILEETGGGATKYEDASEGLDSPISRGLGDLEGMNDLQIGYHNELDTFTEQRKRPRLVKKEERQRRYSFRLSPSKNASSRSPSARNGAITGFSLPFESVLQTLFSIDPSTIQLIQDVSDPSPSVPQSLSSTQTSIFGLTSDVLRPIDDNATIEDRSHSKSLSQLDFEHEMSQGIRLLSKTPAESESVFSKGFSPVQLLPTNPFSFPLYVLNLGWELGIKTFQGGERRER